MTVILFDPAETEIDRLNYTEEKKDFPILSTDQIGAGHQNDAGISQ